MRYSIEKNSKRVRFTNLAVIAVFQLVMMFGTVYSDETSLEKPLFPDTGAVAGLISRDTLTPLATDRDTQPIKSFLQAGDALRIVVYPDTQSFLTGTYLITADGTVDLPMVGTVLVDTFSLSGLEKRLATHYLRYLRYPFVAVSPLVRVGFVGGFGKPGFYYVNPNESFWEALRRSGGPLRQDGLPLMRWERDTKVISDNLLSALEGGKSMRELGMRSGDQFVVTTKPKRERIESFNQDVVPILQVLLTAVSTSATLYIVYRSTGGFAW